MVRRYLQGERACVRRLLRALRREQEERAGAP